MSYEFLRRDRNQSVASYTELAGWVVGLVVVDGPGLFWLYIFVDALRQAESAAFWFGPTSTGETSIFARYVGAITLFGRPLGETVREVRT